MSSSVQTSESTKFLTPEAVPLVRRGSKNAASGSQMNPVVPMTRDSSIPIGSRSQPPELALGNPPDGSQGDGEEKMLEPNFARPPAVDTVLPTASFGPMTPLAQGGPEEFRISTSRGGGRQEALSQAISRLSTAKAVSLRTLGRLSPTARGGGNTTTVPPTMVPKDRARDYNEHNVSCSPLPPTDTSVNDPTTTGIGSPSARDGLETSWRQPTRMNPDQLMHGRGQEDTGVSVGRKENKTRALQLRWQTSLSPRASRPRPCPRPLLDPATTVGVEGVRSAFSSLPHAHDTGRKWVDDSGDAVTRHIQEAATQSTDGPAASAATTAPGGSSGRRRLGDTPSPPPTPGSPGARGGGNGKRPGQASVRARVRHRSPINTLSTRNRGECRGSIPARPQMKSPRSPGAKGEGSSSPPPPLEIQEQRRRRLIRQHRHATSPARRRSSATQTARVA